MVCLDGTAEEYGDSSSGSTENSASVRHCASARIYAVDFVGNSFFSVTCGANAVAYACYSFGMCFIWKFFPRVVGLHLQCSEFWIS